MRSRSSCLQTLTSLCPSRAELPRIFTSSDSSWKTVLPTSCVSRVLGVHCAGTTPRRASTSASAKNRHQMPTTTSNTSTTQASDALNQPWNETPRSTLFFFAKHEHDDIILCLRETPRNYFCALRHTTITYENTFWNTTDCVCFRLIYSGVCVFYLGPILSRNAIE